ncbi:MAG: 50S ribosomal protein L18 [Candidatus Coatesbacteria bacterium]|nr:50S ribosomal protein L18 [Candidatus Coatesbacteria bacterium]
MKKRIHSTRLAGRTRRHERIRKKIDGTSERPRVVINRTLKHFYAQAIDDSTGKTILSMTTNSKTFMKSFKEQDFKDLSGKTKLAAKLGQVFAIKALKLEIKSVVFDRNGFKYHGRVKAFADELRSNGLDF